MINRKKTLDLIELVLILQIVSPIFAYYNLPSTSFAVPTVLNLISLLAIVITLLLGSDFHFSIKGYEGLFFVFCFWMFFQTVTQALIAKYEVVIEGFSFINAMIVLVILLLLPSKIKQHKKACLNAYIFVCRIAIILFLIDLLGDVFGYHLNFSIPILSLQDAYVSAFQAYSPGLFTEPAHFVLFVLPLLIIRLFSFNNEERKKELLCAVSVTFVCILSLSGNGIVCCGIIWFCFFVYQAKKGNRHGLVIFLLGILIFVVLVLILLQIPSFMDVINRLFVDLSGNTYSYTKADYRIYRGFDHFFHLPTVQKVFGIGYKALESYSSYSGITSVYDREFLFEYLNAMCQILIYLGLIGFILFSNCVICMYKRSCVIGKVMIIVFVALSISSSIFLDSTMIMFFLLISVFSKNENELRKEY